MNRTTERLDKVVCDLSDTVCRLKYTLADAELDVHNRPMVVEQISRSHHNIAQIIPLPRLS